MTPIPTLRAMLEAATSTPWAPSETTTAVLGHEDGFAVVVAHAYTPSRRDLIVSAVNALPALLDRLEAAEAVVEAARNLETGAKGDPFFSWSELRAALAAYDAKGPR